MNSFPNSDMLGTQLTLNAVQGSRTRIQKCAHKLRFSTRCERANTQGSEGSMPHIDTLRRGISRWLAGAWASQELTEGGKDCVPL